MDSSSPRMVFLGKVAKDGKAEVDSYADFTEFILLRFRFARADNSSDRWMRFEHRTLPKTLLLFNPETAVALISAPEYEELIQTDRTAANELETLIYKIKSDQLIN